ncbi:hypothetical protein B0H13DRAFT_1898589 [Mycena leptocephala]|nr:hypothetical protein B0H13DRAFT_1898589 [Mycena leptocephala]
MASETEEEIFHMSGVPFQQPYEQVRVEVNVFMGSSETQLKGLSARIFNSDTQVGSIQARIQQQHFAAPAWLLFLNGSCCLSQIFYSPHADVVGKFADSTCSPTSQQPPEGLPGFNRNKRLIWCAKWVPYFPPTLKGNPTAMQPQRGVITLDSNREMPDTVSNSDSDPAVDVPHSTTCPNIHRRRGRGIKSYLKTSTKIKCIPVDGVAKAV